MVVPFGASYFYILSVLELIMYTPLTYYLEKKHNQDKILTRGINQILRKEIIKDADPGSAS